MDLLSQEPELAGAFLNGYSSPDVAYGSDMWMSPIEFERYDSSPDNLISYLPSISSCQCGIMSTMLCPACFAPSSAIQINPDSFKDLMPADSSEPSLLESLESIEKSSEQLEEYSSLPVPAPEPAPAPNTTNKTRKKKRGRPPASASSGSQRKRAPRVKPRPKVVTAETVPRDVEGRPILPLKIGGNFRLISLGTLLPGLPSRWSVHSCPMPEGFASERQFHSLADPTQKVWWRSEIVRGEDGSPRFRVTDPLADPSDPNASFEDTSMGRLWTTVARRVRALQGRSTKSVLSGPKAFGFDRPIVRELINEMARASGASQGRAKRKKN